MNKAWWILFYLLCFKYSSLLAQSTVYYKLDKIVKNGVSSKTVSGGQFITFKDKCCYESDKEGFSVNHGKLDYRYTEKGIKVYSGGSYWGKTIFLFTLDLSALNVKVNDKETYVYKRATPPSGVTTCSLIREKEGGTSSTVVEPVAPPRDLVPVQEWQQCVGCYGSGQCPYVSCGGSGWYFRGDRRVLCSRCHSSGKCTICAGQGGHYITVYR